MIKAYLALGSNLHNPKQQIRTALKEIGNIGGTQLIKASSLYQTSPVGFLDQPDFINAVAEIDTTLSAEDLLSTLLEIEKMHLRVRQIQNGPRTLDIDLLLYENNVITTPFIHVPHPRMKERSFVVCPLAEIAPCLILPCGAAIQDLKLLFTNTMLKVVE